MSERVSGPNGFPPADRPFRHCHRCRTQGIRRGGRIAAEYDPFGYSAPVVEHRDKTRSRMRRERCPARKFARSVIARGRRQRPLHGHPAGRRPTVALGPPARNPLASERFSNNRPPIRPSDKIYQQESPAENRSAERNLVRQRTARQTGPTASAKQMRQPSRTSQQKPAHRARKVRPARKSPAAGNGQQESYRGGQIPDRPGTAFPRIFIEVFAFHGRPVASYVPGTNEKADAFCVGSPYCIQESKQYL